MNPGLETPGMRRIKNIHFVGVGGVGMAGIAEVLLTQGYSVSGSDIANNALTERLKSLGAEIQLGHREENVHNRDVVVVSSAVNAENIEIKTAHQLRIPVVPRALMLGELMRFHYGIAIAGSHGKTTTTSLISSIFAEANLDPTFVIGGKLNSAGSNARLGDSPYFIAEADESDASFLHLNPMISIVTNIDNDHLATYQNDFENLKSTFINFLHNLPFYGLAVLCIDCPVVHSLLPRVSRPYITYGFHPEADIRAIEFKQAGTKTQFKIQIKEDNEIIELNLNLPGQHNVRNALAAFAVAREEGVPLEAIAKGLENFAGIGRRFQVHGEISLDKQTAILVDDYGHHPQEIRSTIQAARLAWPNKRLLMVFQPHRFTRTKQLFDDFAEVLSEVDVLCLMDVYSAGEAPIPNADSHALSHAIRQRKSVEPIFISKPEKLSEILNDVVGVNDIILMQGAGNIGAMAVSLAQRTAKEGM